MKTQPDQKVILRLTVIPKCRRDDFSTVLHRLDEIDETLGTLAKLTRQFTDRSHSSSRGPYAWSGRQVDELPDVSSTLPGTISNRQMSPEPGSIWPRLVLPSSEPTCASSSSEDKVLTDVVELEYGGERTYKYPASMTLIKSLSRKLARKCETTDIAASQNVAGHPSRSPMRDMIRRQLESFPFLSKCPQSVVSNDHQRVVAPPQLIARLFVDGFLENINSRYPIFEEMALRTALDSYYSDASNMTSHSSSTPSVVPACEQNMDSSPWAIIFTNIALLELGLETRVAGWQHSVGGSSSTNISLLTGDLIIPFLRNSDRALADLSPYTRPSLLHVQTLLTLALVTQEFYSNTLFERVLQTACDVGRMLGLHLSRTHEVTPNEKAGDRERVFRVLYGMDKQRVFLTGDPCNIYHFDSDLELWTNPNGEPGEPGSPRRGLTAAFDELMMIWEEVYVKLYSARATAAGTAYLSTQVAGLMQLLTKWHEHHSAAFRSCVSDLDGSNAHNNYDTDDLIRCELKYCYHASQVLVLRCEQSGNERAQSQKREHARSCLTLIADMSNMGGSGPPMPNRLVKARLAALGRILGSYSMAAFFELIDFCFDQLIPTCVQAGQASTQRQGHEFQADMKLFNAFPRILAGLQHMNRPSTYLCRLRLGLEWAVRTLEETVITSSVDAERGELSIGIPTSTSNLLSTGWDQFPWGNQLPGQEQQLHNKHVGAVEVMDSDGNTTRTTQMQNPATTGFTAAPLDMAGGSVDGMHEHLATWDALPYQEDLGFGTDGRAEGAEEQIHTPMTGACGFLGAGMDFWREFLQAKERSRRGV
ncbi:hypothetical protein F4778DRAFT_431468 [Xylariomycetidae sp. FL2044]|nr:hypothetical protein F4778DRAFT_431468 [Xylariomycetidae sp. FL2044]